MQYRYSAKIVDDYFHKNIDIYQRNRYNIHVYLSTCVFVAKIGVTVFRDFPSEAWKPKSTLVSISNGGAHNDSKKGVSTVT